MKWNLILIAKQLEEYRKQRAATACNTQIDSSLFEYLSHEMWSENSRQLVKIS